MLFMLKPLSLPYHNSAKTITMMKLKKHSQGSPKAVAEERSPPPPSSSNKPMTMAAEDKKIKKELKKSHVKSSLSSPITEAGPSNNIKEIEPPRFHRDMRLICDVFRVSEQSRFALRSFDASTLDDFSLMTDEDYADMIVTQARIGKPIPPLQQRKLRILLSWVQSLASSEIEKSSKAATPAKSNDNSTPTSEGGDGKVSPRKQGGTSSSIPTDWENKFYEDLPRLKEELRRMGGQRTSSNWAYEFLSLRWIFCGYEK